MDIIVPYDGYCVVPHTSVDHFEPKICSTFLQRSATISNASVCPQLKQLDFSEATQ